MELLTNMSLSPPNDQTVFLTLSKQLNKQLKYKTRSQELIIKVDLFTRFLLSQDIKFPKIGKSKEIKKMKLVGSGQ